MDQSIENMVTFHLLHLSTSRLHGNQVTMQYVESLNSLTSYQVLFLRPPEYRGAKKLETEEFPPALLFVRVPPGINSPDRRGAAAPAAHKDAQCLSLPVMCQNAFPLKKKKSVSPGQDR